jgi:MFS family permease
MAIGIAARGSEARAIGLVSVGHFCSHFYQLILPPLFVFLKPAFGVSYAQLGLVMTVYFAATALVQVPIGMLVDRIGARWVLIAGLMLHGAAVSAAGFISSYPALLVLFALAGIGNAVFHPADFAILSARVREDYQGRAFGIHSFGGSFGFVAAPITMVALASLWDWRTALVAAGLVAIAVAALMAVAGSALDDNGGTGNAGAGRVRDGGSGKAARPGWRFMLTRPMLLFFLFYVLASGSGTGITNFSVVALMDLYGTPITTANAVLTAFLAAALVGVLPGGHLADATRHHEKVLAAAFVILAASVAAMGTGMLPPVLVFTAAIAAGLMRGLYNASRDVMVRHAAPEGRVGSAFAFVTLGYTVGQGVTPVIYGWIMDAGSPAFVFYLSGVFALLAVATLFGTRKPPA